MGKNKLKKFSDMDALANVFQYPFATLQTAGFPLRGLWGESYFHNDHPIVVELGCGKGEYTVGLARRNPDKNYIGIDIKGARMWTGATAADREGLTNVAFVRTGIEMVDRFFAPGEVSEIWITFPDPQMKKVRKRLTATNFVELYRKVLAPEGIINLKTDSPFLFTYTSLMVKLNGLEVMASTDNLYASPLLDDTLSIRTYYEQQWLDRGLTIKYIAFRPGNGPLEEPADEIPQDTYRSFSRGVLETHTFDSDNTTEL